MLAVPDLHKKVLFAAIHDAKLCHALLSLPIDTVTNASVGMGFDSLSAPGTAFEDIPDDWVCPLCGVGKDDFSPVEE